MGVGEKTSETVLRDQDEPVEFDRALELTGYGRFHYEFLVACAICLLIVGFENGITSYIFPAAQCELKLESSQLGFLNVAFLVGGMCSSFFWGILADSSGRRNILISSLLINAAAILLLTIINHAFALTLCRFLNGFMIGAPGSIIFSYLGEFQPPKLRSGIICGAGVFFTLSWLLLPILAWLILPIDFHIKIGSFILVSPWRIYLILLAGIEAILGFWFMRLPESPKYLLSKGRTEESLNILKDIFASNKRRDQDDYPVKRLYLANAEDQNNFSENVECVGKNSRLLREVWTQIKSLFRRPLLYVTFLTCTIMFTNMFGVFGLGLWLPELFIRFQQYAELHPNETVSVKKLALLSVVKNQTCDATFDVSVIKNTVAMGMTSLVTSAFCGFISTKVSIKVIPFASMLIGGLAAGSIYWLRSATQNLVVACIFQATMIVGNMSASGVVVELFPTNIGAMAICMATFLGRMGAMTSNVVFGLLMDKNCEIPIFAVAINVLFGAILCWIIPDGNASEKKNRKDSFQDSRTVEISLVPLPSKKKIENSEL